MPGKDLTIQFTLGGLDRRLSFQAQKPYTTPDASNVLPSDSLLYRDRGGTRPGMTKYSASDWGNRFTSLTIFTNIDGTRSLIGSNTSGISYGSIAGGSPSSAGGFSTGGRIQAMQFGSNVFFVGDTSLSAPVYMTYSAVGTISGPTNYTTTHAPVVAFPSSYPIAQAVKYGRYFLAYHGGTDATKGRPNRWWASAVDDPFDMEFDDEEDPTTPYSAELNDTNEQITALIPWFGDYMVFATGRQIYVLDGDPHPAVGGRMRRVSDKLGIIDAASWTIGEDSTLIALSDSGPIMLSPNNPLGEPTLILRDKLPGVLSRPDKANYDHTLAFDSRARRVYFFISKLSASSGVAHYCLDLATQGWWPIKFANTDHEPFAAIQVREVASSRSDLLLACRDGYLRVWDETATSDDGTAIESYVWLGPFRANSPRDDGIVNEIVGTMAANSGSVTYGIYAGRNAEEAFNATAEWTGTWAAGRGTTDRPRVRCGTFFVRVSASSGRWAMEEAFVRTMAGGLQRS